MEQSHIDSLVKLYNFALLVLFASIVLGLIGIFEIPLHSVLPQWLLSNGPIDPSYSVTIVLGFVLALPGMLWLAISARKLSGLDKPEQIKKLQSMWTLQSVLGTLTLAGTIPLLALILVILVPNALMGIGPLISIVTSPVGFLSVLVLIPSVTGSWLHFVARSIRGKMTTPIFAPVD